MNKKAKYKKKSKSTPKGKVTAGMFIRLPDFSKGPVPVIIVDYVTKQVLMLAYTREKEFWETFHSHEVVLWSRSRKKRRKKGEEKSGNILQVHEIDLDCDGDTLIYYVSQKNPGAGVCHTGAPTCFSPVILAVFEKKGNTTAKIVPL